MPAHPLNNSLKRNSAVVPRALERLARVTVEVRVRPFREILEAGVLLEPAELDVAGLAVALLGNHERGRPDDAEFLRRITLDLTGTLPTPDEARKFLAEKAGAFWLIDLVASHQTARLRQEAFQVWLLAVNREKTPMAVATCRADTDAPELLRQEIEHTDFPLPSIRLWLVSGVLMLPNEY